MKNCLFFITRALFVFIVLSFLAYPRMTYAQNNRNETEPPHFIVYYPDNGYLIDEQVKSHNQHTFSELDRFLKELMQNHDPDSPRVNISVLASSSIDIGWTYNMRLAERRSVAMRNYLRKAYPKLTDHVNIKFIVIGEDWETFRKLVEADPDIPGRDRLLALISDPDSSPDSKTKSIKAISGGATYRYLMKNIMPELRYVEISVPQTVVIAEPEPDPVPDPVVEPEPPVNELIPDEPEPVVYNLDWGDDSQAFERFWSVKTNLLLLGVGVFNAGVEFPIGERFSIDVPVTFSPYKITQSWRIKTSIIQPEFRWWPNSQMTGHFVGLHGHFGFYNVSLDNETRYQDRGGNTPMWGFGASYGYALPIKQRWGMEFTLGFGYAYLDYDVFYNVPNGAQYDTRQKHYWGITRAGVSLIYKFNLQRDSK